MSTNEILDELIELLGAHAVSVGDEINPDDLHDESLHPRHTMPLAVVHPSTTNDVVAVVRWASEHGIPVTPRGSGTGLSGGATPVPGGVVVAMHRMNSLLRLDPADHVAVVQPGMTLRELGEILEPTGLRYPVYPGELSGSLSGLGGSPDMNRAVLQTLQDGEPDGPLLAGHDDNRPISGFGITQRHVAAAPGVGVDLPARAVHINPAGLGKLGGVGDRPDRRPDGVMPAPGRVGLHGAGVGPDDLVVDRVNGTPDLELGNAIAGAELVHQPGHVERAFVAPLPARLAPLLARPKRFAGALGFLRGVAAVFLVNVPRLAPIDVMVADRADQAVQLRVLFQRIEHLPELAVVVWCLQLHLGKPTSVESRAEVLPDPVQVGAHLVLRGSDPLQFQPVMLARHFQE